MSLDWKKVSLGQGAEHVTYVAEADGFKFWVMLFRVLQPQRWQLLIRLSGECPKTRKTKFFSSEETAKAAAQSWVDSSRGLSTFDGEVR